MRRLLIAIMIMMRVRVERFSMRCACFRGAWFCHGWRTAVNINVNVMHRHHQAAAICRTLNQ